jgi:hypothetical protein
MLSSSWQTQLGVGTFGRADCFVFGDSAVGRCDLPASPCVRTRGTRACLCRSLGSLKKLLNPHVSRHISEQTCGRIQLPCSGNQCKPCRLRDFRVWLLGTHMDCRACTWSAARLHRTVGPDTYLFHKFSIFSHLVCKGHR